MHRFPSGIIRSNWNDIEKISMAARMTRTNREVQTLFKLVRAKQQQMHEVPLALRAVLRAPAGEPSPRHL